MAGRSLPFVRSLHRRTFAGLFAASTLAVLAGCAMGNVHTERDATFDLSAGKTYAWVTEDKVLIKHGEDKPKVRTEANEDRIRAAVDRELSAQGLRKVGKAEADVLVAFSVGIRMRYRLEGGDMTSVLTEGPGSKQTEGTLNVYVFDGQTLREVWHGWTSKMLVTDDNPDTVINTAVGKIMAAYPG